jgi:hypothetical protein
MNSTGVPFDKTFLFCPGFACIPFDGEPDSSEDDEQPPTRVNEPAPTASTKAPALTDLKRPIGPLPGMDILCVETI